MRLRRTVLKNEVTIGVALTTAAVMSLTAVPSHAAEPKSNFGFMFHDLKPFTSPSNQELADLATTMLDPGLDSENNTDPEMTSGYTYLGQFIDHDLTLDTSDNPTSPVDPTKLKNTRTFKLDLDSMYGGGPVQDPQLYDADHKHLKLQDPNINGVPDLQRRPNGTAIVGDSRNDENQIIAQVHVAFIKFHNRIADTESFEAARKKTIEYYQWMVLNDFIPHIADQKTIDFVLKNPDKRFYKPEAGASYTPLEFSVAAFRFGHSMVRAGYQLNTTSGEIPVFSTTSDDLRGGRTIGKGRQLDWGNWLLEFERPDNKGHVNQTRKMDRLISTSLYQLPIPGAEARGSNVLAFRNFTRAKFYGLPSGQTLATAMGVTPIPASKFGDIGPAFADEVPLWYYILGEARMTDPPGDELKPGDLLGPVGSRVVAETIVGVLAADPDSILNNNKDFRPSQPIATGPSELNIEDMLQFAQVAKRPASG